MGPHRSSGSAIRPDKDVVARWRALARAFPETGLWPLVVDPDLGIDRMGEMFMDIERSTSSYGLKGRPNTIRPHQALGQLTPAEYLASIGIDV